MAQKNYYAGYAKGLGNKLIGGAKVVARILDEPIVQAGITALSPEIGAGIGVAKRMGILQKLK